MKEYKCITCGYTVFSNTLPPPIRWNDGHTCQFELAQIKPTHQVHELVKIYEDPLTEIELEGTARLEKFLGIRNGLEWWMVRFIGASRILEETTYDRVIKQRGKK